MKPIYRVEWINNPHCDCGHDHRTRTDAQRCAGKDTRAHVVAYNKAALKLDHLNAEQHA